MNTKQEEPQASSSKVEPLIAAIDGYLCDLTEFVGHHPGTKAKIIAKRAKGIDISNNFLDHYGHTVATFRKAASEFDRKGGDPVVFEFQERPGIPVTIIGRL